MKMLDLFSGIGGFALAATWIWEDDLDIRYFVENDPFCQRVLIKNFPGVPIHRDITTFRYTGPAIDLLCGGFPCQPYSVASRQRSGSEDDRHLWPEMLRIIEEAKPQWILSENVLGIVSMELDQVLSDLEDQGYTCWTFDIPACAIDAHHRRHRIFVVAHTHRQSEPAIPVDEEQIDVADSPRIGMERDWSPWQQIPRSQAGKKISGCNPARGRAARWNPEPAMGRVVDGFPYRVDRLRGLGNAVVPQLAALLMEMIRQCSKD